MAIFARNPHCEGVKVRRPPVANEKLTYMYIIIRQFWKRCKIGGKCTEIGDLEWRDLNDVMAVILCYFAELSCFRG